MYIFHKESKFEWLIKPHVLLVDTFTAKNDTKGLFLRIWQPDFSER